jgi:hypothetical protein
MRLIDVFLRQFDNAWHHRWESLEPLLDGLTEEEALWQAPCYASEPSGRPSPGSIHWHLDHLARCKREYAAMLRRDSGPAHGPPAPLPETLARLRDAHRAQREAIAALGDADLERPAEGGMSVAEFLASTIRHDTWHAAQIAVARRLWRTRADTGP